MGPKLSSGLPNRMPALVSVGGLHGAGEHHIGGQVHYTDAYQQDGQNDDQGHQNGGDHVPDGFQCFHVTVYSCSLFRGAEKHASFGQKSISVHHFDAKGYNTPILFAIIALSGYILRFFFQRKFNKAGNGGMEYVGL